MTDNHDNEGMTREALKQILVDMIQRNSNRMIVVDYETTIDYILALANAQPQSLAGCLHPGNEPLSCQYEGQCLSPSCNHQGKTWRAPRMTVLAQDPNVLYPKKETS